MTCARETTLPDALLARVSETLAAQMGLHYPPQRWIDLERRLAAAARGLGLDSAEACARSLLGTPLNRRQIEILASTLTIGETYFFREPASFDILEQETIPELVRTRKKDAGRRIRVWSAGCATGEEAYSIAIVLARAIADIDRWNVSVLGTDIDADFLSKASLGIYSEWSFRDTPPGVRAAYFTRTADGRFQIVPHVKSLVKFAYLNLVDDNYPSSRNGTNAIDIIFCRNVLIYFEQTRAHGVLEKLGRCLLENGSLFLNPIEAPHVAAPQLVPIERPGASVYRKRSVLAANASSMAAQASAARPHRERTSVPRLRLESAAARMSGSRRTGARAAATRGGKQHPAATQTAHGEAAASYAQGRYDEAVEKLLDIVAREPRDRSALALLVRAYADQGLLEEARRWCEKALQADKLNAGWCYLLSTIFEEQGQTQEAVNALRRALYLDPDHALSHFALGNLARREGNAADAERHFRNALAVLDRYPPERILPDSEGMSAARLAELIRSTVPNEARS